MLLDVKFAQIKGLKPQGIPIAIGTEPNNPLDTETSSVQTAGLIRLTKKLK